MTEIRERSDICRLCDRARPLQASHVIPKFVYRFLSESSRGAGFRNPENINLRIQDGPKRRWLCRDCERLLSGPERWFATNVFRPHLMDGALATVGYDPHLYSFACGVMWRALLLGRESGAIDKRATITAAIAEKILKETLRGWWQPIPFRVAMICSDYIPNVYELVGQTVPGWNRFLRRATMVEFRVVDDETYALVKLPGFCFVAELRQTRPVLQAFNIDVMGGMAELTLGRQRTPVFIALWLAGRSRESDAEFQAMSPRQKQLIDERQSRAYGTYDAPFDHAGASAFLDMLSEEGLRLEEVMERACFCGSQQTFGACHGINLRDRWAPGEA